MKNTKVASPKGIRHATKPNPRWSMVKTWGPIGSVFVWSGISDMVKTPDSIIWLILSLNVSKSGLKCLKPNPYGIVNTKPCNGNSDEMPLRYLVNFSKEYDTICMKPLLAGSATISRQEGSLSIFLVFEGLSLKECKYLRMIRQQIFRNCLTSRIYHNRTTSSCYR